MNDILLLALDMLTRKKLKRFNRKMKPPELLTNAERKNKKNFKYSSRSTGST